MSLLLLRSCSLIRSFKKFFYRTNNFVPCDCHQFQLMSYLIYANLKYIPYLDLSLLWKDISMKKVEKIQINLSLENVPKRDLEEFFFSWNSWNKIPKLKKNILRVATCEQNLSCKFLYCNANTYFFVLVCYHDTFFRLENIKPNAHHNWCQNIAKNYATPWYCIKSNKQIKILLNLLWGSLKEQNFSRMCRVSTFAPEFLNIWGKCKVWPASHYLEMKMLANCPINDAHFKKYIGTNSQKLHDIFELPPRMMLLEFHLGIKLFSYPDGEYIQSPFFLQLCSVESHQYHQLLALKKYSEQLSKEICH